MSRERARRPVGAERRTDPSPFGKQELRNEWSTRIDGFTNLAEALSALVSWRNHQSQEFLTDQDSLWIEARLEERVALLRFEEKTNEDIRTITLTGEKITSVQSRFLEAAEIADAAELENLAAEFRRCYKPPVMPSSPFLRTEVILSEQLMKRRSLNWFTSSITDLRTRRGVKIFKDGWPEEKNPITTSK